MKTIIENLIVCLESVPVEVPGWGVRVQRIHEAREYLAKRRDIFAEIGASEKNVQRDADPVTLPSGREVYQENLGDVMNQTRAHLVQRGMVALDEVKHCEDSMSAEMVSHDSYMRDTPPLCWTETDVEKAEITAQWVNHINR